MERRPNQSGRPAAGHPRFVSGWLFSGSFLGLLIGFAETFVLRTTPRIIPLLVPDVGWVVWFLAPLVDMTCFGLSGLMLGLLAKRGVRKEILIAVQAGFAIAFVITAIACFHLEGLGLLLQSAAICYPLAIFALGTGISLLVILRTYDWLSVQLKHFHK
jgi:hypothetical protein